MWRGSRAAVEPAKGKLANLLALADGSLLGDRLSRKRRVAVVLAVVVVAVVGVSVLPPISDEPSYLRFADTRGLAGLPNFADVVSNLAFVVAGALGVAFVLGIRLGTRTFARPSERWTYFVFFAGVFLAGFGSAYFHLAPDSVRLAVDRIPITVALMGFLAATVADRVGPRLGVALLVPLAAAGLGSVVFWFRGELTGAGDLRPYVLVQYLPMVLVPLLCFLYPSRYTHGASVWGALALYGLAKLGEVCDAAVLSVGHIVSGHTLKHVLGGLAAWWLLRMLQNRGLKGGATTA